MASLKTQTIWRGSALYMHRTSPSRCYASLQEPCLETSAKLYSSGSTKLDAENSRSMKT